MIISARLLKQWYKELNATFFNGQLPETTHIVLVNRKSPLVNWNGRQISISNHYDCPGKDFKTILLRAMYNIWVGIQTWEERMTQKDVMLYDLLKANGYDIFENDFWYKKRKVAEGKEVGADAKIRKNTPIYVFTWVSKRSQDLGTKYFRIVKRGVIEDLYKKCRPWLWYGDLKLIRVVPDESLKGYKTQVTKSCLRGYRMPQKVGELLSKGRDLTLCLEYFGKLLDNYEVIDLSSENIKPYGV